MCISFQIEAVLSSKNILTMSFSIIVKIRQKTIKCHNAFFACLHVSYSNSTDHWPVITQSRYSVPSIYALQVANNFGQQKWDFCWEKRKERVYMVWGNVSFFLSGFRLYPWSQIFCRAICEPRLQGDQCKYYGLFLAHELSSLFWFEPLV